MTDEEFTKETIDAYHAKGIPVWSGDLVNKGSFLTQVKLYTFFDGSELPFEIEGILNIKTRMPFGKARMILPRPMFDPALPMVSKVEPLRYKNLAYLYTEVRGVNDVNNTISKTAEFLLIHEWVAVVQTSKDTKMYLFPTCSLSHELGITHKNHPQMLHGLFVKFLVNKGTQTPQGYTVEQLYKAGLAKPDKQITRDKVTVYQIKSDKPKEHMMLNDPDAEENSKISDSKPVNESTESSVTLISSEEAATSDSAATTISNTLLVSSTISSTVTPTATPTTASTMSSATDVTASSNANTTGTVTTSLPTTTTSTSSIVSSSTGHSSASPIVISDSTTAAKDTVSSISSDTTSSKNGEDVKGTEPKIGQKRPATDISGASTPKRTRELLRNSLQQLLEGKSSVSEDDTPKTPTKSTNITDVQLDNITVTDEVFQRLESAMSMISNRELHSIIKPLQTSSSSSPTKLQPVVTTSADSVVKAENDNLTSSTSTASPTSVASLTEDKTNTQFNVPTVVYSKPCKRPKSILKGCNKLEQLDDANLVSEDSPTSSTSAKVPRKIGLAEYKKRHKERRDSEDVAEDASINNFAMEVVAENTGKDTKTPVDSSSSSPTNHLMIIDNTECTLDGTATSKANSDVSVSFKEEKKGDSPPKSESLSVVFSKGQYIGKPVKIPHPMSVLAPSSSAIIPHKYTSNLAELSMPYYPGPTFRHDWTTNYPVFGGLSRPYLMPHPPTAPLPSNILTAPLIPSVPPPPPVVYDPVSTQKADEEMARVEDLTEMFTKNLQNKLKRVIGSDDSSRESSPKPRRSRSLSRSQSPPPRSSRRGRSPRRSRKSNSRSQSLDSCRGSDHEQVRSRSKSPRSHKSHRSRRHRSSSRDSSVEDRRYSRNLKRRNDKRRDYKTTLSSNLKTISTQTEENTYKSGDTKRLSEKEIQTDKLLFVHSKGSQTYPMFENHKAVQVDTSVASNFYADFAQYLETYPLDMFNFRDILSTSISYFEQEISKAFPCNKTLTSKQLKRILEFNHMKKLRSKLSTLLKESQNLNPYMAGVYRSGTPVLDDNQPGVLKPAVLEGGDGNEQQPYEEDSSGLSNSEILSDSEGSNDNVPNLSELLSQYQNNGKATQEHTGTPPAETTHTTPTKSQPDEAAPNQPIAEHSYKQSIKSEDNTCNLIAVHKVTGQLDNIDDTSTSNITVKEEGTEVDKSFVPENYGSPPSSSKHFKTHDHTYSEARRYPSGGQFKVVLDPSTSETDRTFLTVSKRTKTSKSSGTGQKRVNPEVLGEEIYHSIRKGCEEFLSSNNNSPDHYTGEDGDKLSIESDHNAVDMEISLTDSQTEEDSQGSAEEKVTDDTKSQHSKSSQLSTEDKNKSSGSTSDSKAKAAGHKASVSTKDLHHYTSYHAVPLHYQAQPFKYGQQQRRPVLYYGTPGRPEAYNHWDWRRGYGWGIPRY